MPGRGPAVLSFHVVASQHVVLTIYAVNCVVSYPFKGKFYKEKKKAKIKRE
jgi:hypothetical protein